MAKAILPDGKALEVSDGASLSDVAAKIGPRLAEAAIAAELDGKLVDLSTPLAGGDHQVRILTARDREALEVLRHSATHVMAQAVRRLFGKDVQYTIGPALMDDFQYGFYYDFELPGAVAEADLERIEKEMNRIVGEKLPFVRRELPADQAIAELRDRHQQRYKEEIIRDLARDEQATVFSLYEQGEFLDLCRGPHVPHTGKIGPFKLLTTAGAYWRGDVRNRQLTRIYGVAFFNKAELDAHLVRIEEARKRDHRVLGRQLKLFLISDVVGQGLPLWLPRGTIVRTELQNWLQSELRARGYDIVMCPHIGNLNLYRTSGHYPYYEDSQFPPIHMVSDAARELVRRLREARDQNKRLDEAEERALVAAAGEAPDYPWDVADVGRRYAIVRELYAVQQEEGYLLKPMNCPHHIQIYKSAQRSYRELPVRLSEFGTVYRYEQSGVLTGLTRVRGFTQDDAHIFCTPDQLESEVESCVELTKLVLAQLGLTDYRVRVGLRDPDSSKYTGRGENWDRAEQNLRNVVRRLGMNYSEEPGEAAFYGPKIDFVVKDCIGREWQLGTIQVDYNLPERFGLEYIGPDNAPHRPVMIHRAPLGSLERFTGILIEHFGGAFPLWLAPVQVAVLPVSEKTADYAAEVTARLRQGGLRVELDDSPDKIGAKIRRATVEKVPYMLIVGPKEAESQTVSVRERSAGDIGPMPVDQFVARLREEADSRALASVLVPAKSAQSAQ